MPELVDTGGRLPPRLQRLALAHERGGEAFGAGLQAPVMPTASIRRIATAVFLVLAVGLTVAMPLRAGAHTGGPLDADGCHADHRTGSYHCHRGAAAGYTFPNRNAMLEAVRTNTFPEKTVEKEGFFSKLWPFGKKDEDEEAAADGAAPPAADPAAPVVPEKQRQLEEKLKVLQGLYEMGLITKDEYEQKRKAVLDEI
jgi:hypothetical protein